MIGTSGGVQFDLTGPANQTLFSDLQANSSLVTLPATGTYVLTAHGSGGQGGSYAFELAQTSVSTLTLGTADSGTLAGSGGAQIFEVNVPTTESLAINLADSTSTDINQVYAQLGSPPTPGNSQYSSSGVKASPQLLIPSAAPGHVVHPGVTRSRCRRRARSRSR